MSRRGKNSGEQDFLGNFMFLIGVVIAFSIAWPLGILMILWRTGVFKKSGERSVSSGSKSSSNLRMDKYRIMAEGRSGVSIEYLANAIGVSYDTALRDLQRMVAEGQFGAGAYINYVDRTLIIDPAAARRSPPPQATVRNRPSGGAEGSNMISRAQTQGGVRSARVTVDEPRNEKPKGEKRERKKPLSGPKTDQPDSMRRLMLLIGVVLLAVGGIMGLSAIEELPFAGVSSIANIVESLAMMGGGAGCLIYRGFLKKRENRIKVYQAVCKGRDFVSIEELASKVGVSVRKCKRDLDSMLERGLFSKSAYIDQGDGVLILKSGVSPKPEAEPEPVEDNEDRYKAIIKEIRQLNDRIPDEDVSRRIDEMEELTSAIFRAVRDKPEKEPQIKSFMSYYLPTTLKLLGSYAQFEQSGADGENIRNAKAEIERILDTLVDGFKKQLDKLYESDAMDISSDIDVLETMLRRDGLTGDGSAFNVQSGK